MITQEEREDLKRYAVHILQHQETISYPHPHVVDQRSIRDLIDALEAAESRVTVAEGKAKAWRLKHSRLYDEMMRLEQIAAKLRDVARGPMCSPADDAYWLSQFWELARRSYEDTLYWKGRAYKAEKTLKGIGYTDEDGELWKPPLDAPPDSDLIERERADRTEAALDALAGHYAGQSCWDGRCPCTVSHPDCMAVDNADCKAALIEWAEQQYRREEDRDQTVSSDRRPSLQDD